MADAANNANEEARVSPAAEANRDDLEFLRDAARTIPPLLLKDLLSNGVCTQCIFRLFNLHEQISSRPSLGTPNLRAILHELTEHEEDGANSSVEETEEDFKVCRVCVGILQFVYNDDKGMLVKKDHATHFAAAIGDVIKKEGYQLDSFALEVSLPLIIVENEQAVWLYMTKKYGSEVREKYASESMAVKDFLKLSVINPIEKLLDAKSNEGSFRIRLTYTQSNASAKEKPFNESNECYKRRKVDEIGSIKNIGGLHKDERHNGMDSLTFPIEKVNQCCSLSFQCCKTPIYIGGRYLKYSRNVSQSRWIIDDERMGEASVEEIIGGHVLPICRGDIYKFHAAGREDIDVRMLGTGRPFLVEIQNARQSPSDVLIKDIEMKINSLESKLVRVKNLKFLGSQGWDLMREGEAEKQKQYAALVWISRPLTDDDTHALLSLKEMQILQKTPVRVLHRRSPLEREKTIHWMRIERIAGSSHYFLLQLCTQAGTYIKEFVHGDLGRTHPSVGSILGCRAEIVQLDVTDVKMDCFQE
ncbi:hypothetical protein CASFOL_012466 [Castilleja foliolosa]|uniref:tRNA pseudouridine(55) synthase n=1 Tax=Castilleja foliolosa TaxID=1961234 RepID=A0ABD3DL75_9LAMI